MNKRYHMMTSRYRDEWRKDVGMNRITACVDGPIVAIDQLEAKLGDLKKTNRFSATGLAEEMRTFARKDTAIGLRKAGHVVDEYRESLQRSKDRLRVPKPDKSDVAGAILRMDIRNWLKALNRGELSAVLLAKDAPENILQAAYEVPPAMIGADAAFMENVQERLLEIHHAPMLKQIAEIDEAITIANNVIQVSLMDMQKCLMFDRQDQAFRQWFDYVSTDVDRQFVAERLQKQQTDAKAAELAALLTPKAPSLTDRRVEALNNKAWQWDWDKQAIVYNDPELNAA